MKGENGFVLRLVDFFSEDEDLFAKAGTGLEVLEYFEFGWTRIVEFKW